MTTASIAVAAFRACAVERAVAGLTLLSKPDAVSRLIAPAPTTAPPTWLSRALGARLLAQALVEYARPTRHVALAGAAIDATHAGSMIPLAASHPAYRRVAAASALEAAAAAVVAGLVARRLP